MKTLFSIAILLLPLFTLADTTTENPEKTHCVDRVVNGEVVRDYDCMGKMMFSSDARSTQPLPQIQNSETIAGKPSTALGLANTEATRQRMGNNFGKSTLPQRPANP